MQDVLQALAVLAVLGLVIAIMRVLIEREVVRIEQRQARRESEDEARRTRAQRTVRTVWKSAAPELGSGLRRAFDAQVDAAVLAAADAQARDLGFDDFAALTREVEAARAEDRRPGRGASAEDAARIGLLALFVRLARERVAGRGPAEAEVGIGAELRSIASGLERDAAARLGHETESGLLAAARARIDDLVAGLEAERWPVELPWAAWRDEAEARLGAARPVEELARLLDEAGGGARR